MQRPDVSPRSFAGYSYQQKLRSGPYGDVYLATSSGGQDACVLEIEPTLAGMTGFADALTIQAEALGRLDHANVVETRGAGRASSGRLVVVTGLTSGHISVQDLFGRVAPGGLPQAVAAGIGKQLVKGLAAASELGVVHGAVHARSVLIDAGGVVRMDDLAVGRALAAVISREPTSPLRDSLAGYLAPERMRGKAASAASDVYAAAAVVYVMLTGTLPPGTVDISPGFERMIQRALDASVARRYASTVEFLENYTEALEDDLWPCATPAEIAAFVAGLGVAAPEAAAPSEPQALASEPLAAAAADAAPVDLLAVLDELADSTSGPVETPGRGAPDKPGIGAPDKPGVGAPDTGVVKPEADSIDKIDQVMDSMLAELDPPTSVDSVPLGNLQPRDPISELISLAGGKSVPEDVRTLSIPPATGAPPAPPARPASPAGPASPAPASRPPSARPASPAGPASPAPASRPPSAGPDPQAEQAALAVLDELEEEVEVQPAQRALSASMAVATEPEARPLGELEAPTTPTAQPLDVQAAAAPATAAAPAMAAKPVEPEARAAQELDATSAASAMPPAASPAAASAPAPASSRPTSEPADVRAARRVVATSPVDALDPGVDLTLKKGGAIRWMMWLLVCAGGIAALVWVVYNQRDMRAQAEKDRERQRLENEAALAAFRGAQPRSGQVTIDSQPAEAAVWMLLGRTPLETNPMSSAMLHELRLELDGHLPHDLRVAAEHWTGAGEGRQAAVRATLRAGTPDRPVPAFPPEPSAAESRGLGEGQGAIRVESEPPGAQVWLLVGFTPGVTITGYADVDYEFKVSKDGYLPGYAVIRSDDWKAGGSSDQVSRSVTLQKLDQRKRTGRSGAR